MGNNTKIYTRKNDHIRINLEEDVRSGITAGLEHIHLEHCALPEINLSDIDLSATFLKKTVQLPLLVSSMTGGTPDSDKINIHLAEAAQEMGVAMGLGSQRVILEHKTDHDSFRLRRFAPDIPILANIGAVQLNYGIGLPECQKLVEMASADALILHLNPLQEALQPEGNTNFSQLLPKIAQICQSLPVPVIVKEVGWGLSAKIARELVSAGVSVLDIAGAGGTSWSQVEFFRTSSESDRRIAAHFSDWGIPTANALRSLAALNLGVPLIASGGISSGVEIAKCLAIGADLCGMAGRFLKAASSSTEAVLLELGEIKKELQITLFACGASNIESLKQVGISYRD